jgi:type I restriction enzyme M protein
VQQAILDSPEFQQFATAARNLAVEWFAAHRETLVGIHADTRPGDLIEAIGDDLLARFMPVALLDGYDVYEQLLEYWNDVMHDDVFLVMNDGWLEAAKPRKAIENKERKLTEMPDLVIGSGRSTAKYKMDLIPPALVVARYFASEQAKVDELVAAAEEATRSVEEYIEEHGSEDGPLSEAMDDDKITKALAAARLKVARWESPDAEELDILHYLLKLYDVEAVAKKSAKEAQAKLDLATFKQYGKLGEDEIKTLVLNDKWQAAVLRRISSEVESLTLDLVVRLNELGGRYAETIGQLDQSLYRIATKIEGHLAAMGVQQ